MTAVDPDTDELLRRSADGDRSARGALLHHRGRLKRMIALRLDPRLAARVDLSDLVQEVLAEADVQKVDPPRRQLVENVIE
jgi:RNA polymerase sigma-70 factor (ECF subfamily)